MVARSCGVGLAGVLLGIVLVNLAPAQRAKLVPKPKPAPAAPADPLVIKPGDPISNKALVQYPAELRGAVSWTLDSRHHRGPIFSMAVSPDGRFLATGGIDCMIRIWDMAQGKLLRVLAGHSSYVYGLAWSSDNRTLASAGSWDGTVRVWNAETGQMVRGFYGKELKTPVMHVAWAPDGTRLMIAGGLSGYIKVWNTSSEAPTDLMEFGQYISVFTWSPDGTSFALCGSQSGLSIIDFQTAKVAHTLGMTTDGVNNVSWSPNGKYLATSGVNAAAVWDVAEEKVVKQYPGACVSIAFGPDGRTLAVGRSGGTEVYNLANDQLKAKIPAVGTRMLWPKEPGQLAMYYLDRVSAWNVAEKPTATLDDAPGVAPPVWVQNRPIVTGVGTTKLALWDATSMKHLRGLEGHKLPVACVSWSRDGKLLATAAADRLVRIFDAKSGELLQTLEGNKSLIMALAFSGDGKTLASAGYDNSVRLWTAGGESLGALEGHSAPVRALAWAPMGGVLASGGDDQTVLMWRVGNSQPTKKILIHQNIYSLAFTTANKALVLACGTADENLQVLNAGSGQLINVLKQSGSPPTVTAVTWLPGSGMLLAGRGNYTAQVWDVGQQKVVHNLQAGAGVQYVTQASSGATLIAGSGDRTTRFWGAEDGKLRGTILGEPGYAVMIGADGNWKMDPERECDLVYVVVTPEGQLTLSPAEFAERFRTKNNPTRVKLTPR
jgi:WD40 repeat protein